MTQNQLSQLSKPPWAIADCLSSLDALIYPHTDKFEAPKKHKKGLMQQLFLSQEAVGV